MITLAAGLALLGLLSGCSSLERSSPDRALSERWSPDRPFSPERSSPDRPLAPDPTPALARLAPPEGVDAALWEQLKSALREALAQPQPGAGALGVSDLAITVIGTQATGATAQFSWTYVSGGDYDQNGEVNIGDLTPLGLHFGKTAQSADWAAAQLADGDGNGEINIADVTPIGVNYGARVEGYVLQAAPTGGVSAPWQDVVGAARLLADGSTPPGGGPLGFSLGLADPGDGLHYRVQPYAGTLRGPGSNEVIAAVPPAPQNQPPLALLGLNPQGGSSPASIFFSGGASSDDGGIVRYEWDLDGDGAFEYDSGGDPNARYIYFEPGSYTVTLRVWDAQGLSDTTAKQVNVTLGASWHIKPVAETFLKSDGFPASILDVGGRPAFFYNTVNALPTGDGIAYKLAADSHADSWEAPVFVADAFQVDGAQTLPSAIVDGRPAVAVATNYGGDSFARWFIANDASGADWPATGSVAISGFSQYESLFLALVEGRPCLASAPRLTFASALDNAGALWNLPLELDETYSTGGKRTMDMRAIDGLPELAYHDRDTGYLKFIRALDASATDWSVPLPVASVGDVGAAPMLFDCSGLPGVAFYDDTTKSLKFTRAAEATGESWSFPIIIAQNASGMATGLKWQGLPMVAYWQRNSALIKFVCACNEAGDNWTVPLEAASNVAQETPMGPPWELRASEVGGMPVYCYTTWADPLGAGQYSNDLWTCLYY